MNSKASISKVFSLVINEFYVCAFGLFFLVSACNYQKVALTSTSGKKFRYRAYNTSYQQQAYNGKYIFRWRRSTAHFKRYLGTVERLMIDSILYVQTDTMRLKLNSKVSLYSPLFTSGLLYGHLFTQKSPTIFAPVGLYYQVDSAGRKHTPCVRNWCGYTLNIGLIEEPDYLRVFPKCRRFKLCIMNDSDRTRYSNFYVEIRNEQATTYIPIADFVKEASVTFIASTGYHI